jgi:YfiH family protein
MKNDGLKVHRFKLFEATKSISHGVFTRAGGKSKAPFGSLNVGINCGDELSSVLENREKIRCRMGNKPLVFLNQVHGTDIMVLKKNDGDLSQIFQDGGYISRNGGQTPGADGVVTDRIDVSLAIQVADCQAVILYDAKKKVIGNVHSGWRGSIQDIIGKCVDTMIREFGCQPENIIAGISPSLGPCCSEFLNYKDEIPQDLWKYKLNGENYFDFWQMSKDQLVGRGVKKDNIESMNICTKCNTKDFYSYRAEKKTGRFTCVIGLQ